MAYVQINAGKVTAVYGGPQPGVTGCAEVADNDPGLLAFFAAQNPAKPQLITSVAFLNRFPAGVVETLYDNPQMGSFLIMCAAAGTINLADPGVQTGVSGLVPAFLTQAQALAILDH
jgi:hypothetical protein